MRRRETERGGERRRETKRDGERRNGKREMEINNLIICQMISPKLDTFVFLCVKLG